MAEYSKQFLEAIKHPRIQGTVRKIGDRILYQNNIYRFVSESPMLTIYLENIEEKIGLSSSVFYSKSFFIPEVYNSRNSLRSLIGMLGNQYTIEKYPLQSKTWYEVKFEFKRKGEKILSERIMRGTDFQLTLLEAIIFKKTGQTWNQTKKMWSEELYKL